MASTDRVVSTRFTEAEFAALQSLSILTGENLNALIRRAVHQYAQSVLSSDMHKDMERRATQRAIESERALRRSIGIDTGTLPRITV
jgi:hypothetical protein